MSWRIPKIPKKTLTQLYYPRDLAEPHLEPGWPIHLVRRVLGEGVTVPEVPTGSLAGCLSQTGWHLLRTGAGTHKHSQVSGQLQNILISNHNLKQHHICTRHAYTIQFSANLSRYSQHFKSVLENMPPLQLLLQNSPSVT